MKHIYNSLRTLAVICTGLSMAVTAQAQAPGEPSGPVLKTTASGLRMIAGSDYVYSGGTLAPFDSTEFFFPSLSTDVYDRYDTYTAFGSGTFRPDAKYLYTFDALGRLKQVDVQRWKSASGAYVASSRTLDSFNSAGQQIHQLGQQWNPASGAYVNWNQTFLVRNGANMILDQRTQNWVPASSGWVNDRHIINTFNTQGRRTGIVYQRWKTATSSWSNTDSFSSVYDASGLQNIANYNFGWDATANAWVPGTRQALTYDAAGNRTVVLSEVFNASAWVPTLKDSTSYTATNQPAVNILKVWNPATSSYDNQSRVTYTYNAADLVTVIATERWASGAWTLLANGGQVHNKYYGPYGTAAGLPGTQGTAPELTLSPNPVSGSLHFTLRTEAPQSFRANIIDLQGRVLQSFSAQTTKQFNIDLSTTSMPSGNYIVRVVTEGGATVSRLIAVQH